MSAVRMQKPDNIDQADWDALQGEFSRLGTQSMTPEQLYNARPEQLGNDPAIELQWAEKAGKHAETYGRMLTIYRDKRKLKLTPIDEQIYAHFRRVFPTMNVEDLSVNPVHDHAAQWQQFVAAYEHNPQINDCKFGTILRTNSRGAASADNCTLVTRMVFLAVEIARNHEGYNDHITQQ